MKTDSLPSKDCTTTSFKALMLCVFLTSLNSNTFKLGVSFYVLRDSLDKDSNTFFVSLIAALFVLPFILFSPFAGVIADRFSKHRIIQCCKLMELAAIIVGACFLLSGLVYGMLFILFILGVIGTLFSPCKYGILPELLDSSELSRGNGYMEFSTFISIVSGTILAGVLASMSGEVWYPLALTTVLISSLGFLSSLKIASSGYQGASISLAINPFIQLKSDLLKIFANKALFIVLLNICYFWTYGAFFQINALLYAEEIAKLTEGETTFMLTAIAFGIGTGSITAGRISHDRIQLIFSPFAAFGMGLFTLFIAYAGAHYLLLLFATLCLGTCLGFYIVPLDAFFQHNTELEKRGRYIAAGNFLSFSGMTGASLFVLFAKYMLGLDPSMQFVVFGIISFIVSVVLWIWRKCVVIPNSTTSDCQTGAIEC